MKYFICFLIFASIVAQAKSKAKPKAKTPAVEMHEAPAKPKAEVNAPAVGEELVKGYPQALCDYVGFQLSFKRDREPFDKIQSKFSETFAPERHNCSAESLNKFHEESDELCKAKFNANPGMNTDQFLDIMGSLRRCNDLNRELFQTIVFAFKNGYESCKN